MNIISISHKKAGLEERSRFAFSDEDKKEFRRQLFEIFPEIRECVILSTCNRCEIFWNGDDVNVKEVEKFLCRYKNVPHSHAIGYLGIYTGSRAIRHLTRVACGIDSMVLGEDEILRQIKEAYYEAHESGATDYELNTIFQMAIAAAKEIKTSTGLSTTPVSIGTLVANMVSSLISEGYGNKVMILGITGKIGNITAKNIVAKGGVIVTGTTRKHNAEGLLPSYPQINMAEFHDRYELMKDMDIIISSTASPHYTVTADEYIRTVGNDRKRVFIDLAVPPDIDSNIEELDNCRLVTIDYFKKLSEHNNILKEEKAQDARKKADMHADEIEKELRLHEIIAKLPEIREMISVNGIDKLIYGLRKKADKEQVEQIADWLLGNLI